MCSHTCFPKMFEVARNVEQVGLWTCSRSQYRRRHHHHHHHHHHHNPVHLLPLVLRKVGSSSLCGRVSFPAIINFTVSYDQCSPGATMTQHSANIREYTYEEASEKQYLFNRVAPMYDDLNELLSFGLHKVWKRMCVLWSRVAEGNTVLDLCCGSGDIALILAQKVGMNGKVVGLDFAKEQLELAMQRQYESPLTSHYKIEWRLGDALNLPFEEATFDAITVGYGLRNVDDIPRALKEIYRVLKPGSTTSILDFNRSASPSTRDLQEWVLDNVVVPIAGQAGLEKEYAYIKRSLSRFPIGKEQEILALKEGFSLAVHYEIAGGLMGVLVATK